MKYGKGFMEGKVKPKQKAPIPAKVRPAFQAPELTEKQLGHIDESMTKSSANEEFTKWTTSKTQAGNEQRAWRDRISKFTPVDPIPTSQGMADARLRSKRQIQVAKGRAAQRTNKVLKVGVTGLGATVAGGIAGKIVSRMNNDSQSSGESSWSQHKRQQRGY